MRGYIPHRTIIIIFGLVAWRGHVAHAQSDLYRDCNSAYLLGTPPAGIAASNGQKYVATLVASVDTLIGRGDYLGGFRRVSSGFEVQALPATTNLDALEIQTLRRAFALEEDSIAAFTRRDSVTRVRTGGATLRPQRFRPLPRSDPGARYVLFAGESDSIVIRATMNAPLRRIVCWNAVAASAALDRITESLRVTVAEHYAALQTSWTRYFGNGYSRVPWEELAFPDRRSGNDLTPPTTQIVFLHPAIGVEVAGPDYTRLERLDALTLEVVGRLRYRDDYRSYSGASLVLSTSRQVGTGGGVMIHFAPAISGGYVLAFRGKAIKRGGVIMSVDLYKYLVDRKTKLDDTLVGVRKTLGIQ